MSLAPDGQHTKATFRWDECVPIHSPEIGISSNNDTQDKRIAIYQDLFTEFHNLHQKRYSRGS